MRNVRAIGNSRGVIIPKAFLEELGSPSIVEMTLADGQIVIRPSPGKVTRGKPRSRGETAGLYRIMEAKINRKIRTGKTRWTGPRELERKL